MDEEAPIGHDHYKCYHCGEDFRTHTRQEQFQHAALPPVYRWQRDDVIQEGIKNNTPITEVAKQLGGKFSQQDMNRMIGRDKSGMG
jgi:hypothetical protein